MRQEVAEAAFMFPSRYRPAGTNTWGRDRRMPNPSSNENGQCSDRYERDILEGCTGGGLGCGCGMRYLRATWASVLLKRSNAFLTLS